MLKQSERVLQCSGSHAGGARVHRRVQEGWWCAGCFGSIEVVGSPVACRWPENGQVPKSVGVGPGW